MHFTALHFENIYEDTLNIAIFNSSHFGNTPVYLKVANRSDFCLPLIAINFHNPASSVSFQKITNHLRKITYGYAEG